MRLSEAAEREPVQVLCGKYPAEVGRTCCFPAIVVHGFVFPGRLAAGLRVGSGPMAMTLCVDPPDFSRRLHRDTEATARVAVQRAVRSGEADVVSSRRGSADEPLDRCIDGRVAPAAGPGSPVGGASAAGGGEP